VGTPHRHRLPSAVIYHCVDGYYATDISHE
jgi:hypothetical protein